MNPDALPAYLGPLNDSQREAVLHEGRALLILAGAGSGKTRVITSKIAYLIDRKGYDPRGILAVTFTNKAAGEMRERVARTVPGSEGVAIRTFHSFGAWALRRYGGRIGIQPSFTIYDDDDVVSLLQSVTEGASRRDLDAYAHWIGRAKDYGLGPDDDLLPISADPQLPSIYRAYESRLREIGNVDFGDLILRCLELLRAEPAAIRGRFRAVLVDEYQDSNVAQYELLKELVDPSTYLCVVGDDDQSIYRFRGAEVRNILTFADAFPGTSVVRLEENYRSTRNILAIASSVVANNKGRLGKTLWTQKPEGKKALLVYLRSHEEEAELVAELLRDGRLEETAVLYRTNAQSHAFETLFAQRGIPYRLVGSLRFYEREEIKDATSLLALLANPRDEVAFRRIVNKPVRGVGGASAERIVALAAGHAGDLKAAASAAARSLPGRAGEGARAFARLLDDLGTALDELPLSELLTKLVTASGLLEFHRLKDPQKARNLEELVNTAVGYGAGREALAQFLERIELDRSSISEEEGKPGDRVTLITMHNTKGLEFDRVVITGLEDDLFPGRRDLLDDAVEEERRLFYVSVTRAREELVLTTCRTRLVWGRTARMEPSRFLFEIPEELLRVEGRPPAGDSGGYEVGTEIYHDEYGSGTVFKRWYNEGELVVQVLFESGMTARFIPKYARLERIGQDG